MNNRHDLIVDYHVTQATDNDERNVAKEMAAALVCSHHQIVTADKKYGIKVLWLK